MTGDYFTVMQDADGCWHWKLRCAHQPTHHPIARSGIGYKTRSAALRSVRFRSQGYGWCLRQKRDTKGGRASLEAVGRHSPIASACRRNLCPMTSRRRAAGR